MRAGGGGKQTTESVSHFRRNAIKGGRRRKQQTTPITHFHLFWPTFKQQHHETPSGKHNKISSRNEWHPHCLALEKIEEKRRCEIQQLLTGRGLFHPYLFCFQMPLLAFCALKIGRQAPGVFVLIRVWAGCSHQQSGNCANLLHHETSQTHRFSLSELCQH